MVAGGALMAANGALMAANGALMAVVAGVTLMAASAVLMAVVGGGALMAASASTDGCCWWMYCGSWCILIAGGGVPGTKSYQTTLADTVVCIQLLQLSGACVQTCCCMLIADLCKLLHTNVIQPCRTRTLT